MGYIHNLTSLHIHPAAPCLQVVTGNATLTDRVQAHTWSRRITANAGAVTVTLFYTLPLLLCQTAQFGTSIKTLTLWYSLPAAITGSIVFSLWKNTLPADGAAWAVTQVATGSLPVLEGTHTETLTITSPSWRTNPLFAKIIVTCEAPDVIDLVAIRATYDFRI